MWHGIDFGDFLLGLIDFLANLVTFWTIWSNLGQILLFFEKLSIFCQKRGKKIVAMESSTPEESISGVFFVFWPCLPHPF